MRHINFLRLVVAKYKSMTMAAFALKAWGKLVTYVLTTSYSWRDIRFSTRGGSELRVTGRFIYAKELIVSEIGDELLAYQSSQYLNHNFDLLGSGPLNVAYGNCYVGFDHFQYRPEVRCYGNNEDNARNLLLRPHVNEALNILKNMDSAYILIDWQVDFKSGFRWSEKTPSSKIRYGDVAGADIKVPWELARLQHLPQLAIHALRNAEASLANCKEIKNQILDFIAMNPPRMGVNWVCAMDVGIRASNMLIANDIIENLTEGALDDNYRSIFADSIYEHGVHIVNHLEYSPELTSNHYLANVVGLLFISSYLEPCGQTNQWLAFSLQEIINEVRRQYHTDGTNFEGSTSYHRLSTEMLVYAVALLKGLPANRIEQLKTYSILSWEVMPRLKGYKEQEYKIVNGKLELPRWFNQLILAAIKFSIDITKPDGNICQIGDNDSGRLFKLASLGVFLTKNAALDKYLNLSDGKGYRNDKYWDENCLNHSPYISAASAIFDIELPEYITECQLEKSIALSISKGNMIEVEKNHPKEMPIYKTAPLIDSNARKSIEIYVASMGEDSLLNGLRQCWYPDSQIVIFRSSRLYLCLYSVPNGSRGNGVHSHNDQMSIELQIDGENIACDPGAYLYTSSPSYRNLFRGVEAHNVLRSVRGETNRFFGSANALFAKEDESRTAIFNVTKSGCTMQLEFYGVKQQRVVSIERDVILIKDSSNFDFDNQLNCFKYFSKGFGFLEASSFKSKRVKIEYVNG